MHRLFRKCLDDATGVSESVIVVVVDIRGFSAFSERVESLDTAMFLKRVYTKLIDAYFPFASFYKSTGDGLLVAIPWDENNLREVSQKVTASCIACHSEFGSICSGDPVINFKVPDKIGIGVARGTACRLVSGSKTIDYSGRLLNLTFRLNDLARPSGIVIDGAFGISLLEDEQRNIFEEDSNIYLPGIAEDKPRKIHFTPEFTVLQDYNKQPIAEKRWRHYVQVKPYGEFLKLAAVGTFRCRLESEPITPDEVEIEVQHALIINGQIHPGASRWFEFSEFRYELDRGEPVVLIDFPKLCERLKQEQITEDVEVTLTIAYPER